MLLTEQKIPCKMCEKETKTFSGMEEISILDRGIIYPLCKECSIEMRDLLKLK